MLTSIVPGGFAMTVAQLDSLITLLRSRPMP